MSNSSLRRRQTNALIRAQGSITIQILSLQASFASYIRAAIFQSGFAATSTLNKASAHQAQWNSFVEAAGCGGVTTDTLHCLQNADTDTIMNATWQVVPDTSRGWFPNLDDDMLPDLPSRIWASGSYARVPFIAGTHLDDGEGLYAYAVVVLTSQRHPLHPDLRQE